MRRIKAGGGDEDYEEDERTELSYIVSVILLIITIPADENLHGYSLPHTATAMLGMGRAAVMNINIL